MTREEFRGALSDIDEGGRLSHSEEARKAEILLLDHDKEQRAEIARLREALELYKNASYQSHNGHWDMTMQGGKGCPECIRARELRVKADEILAKDALKETP